MSEKRFIVDYDVGVLDTKTNKIICDTVSADEVVDLLNGQQATIQSLKEENEQLKNELRKEKSLREYSDSMIDVDLIVNIRFSNGEWKADVSVIDDE